MADGCWQSPRWIGSKKRRRSRASGFQYNDKRHIARRIASHRIIAHNHHTVNYYHSTQTNPFSRTLSWMSVRWSGCAPGIYYIDTVSRAPEEASAKKRQIGWILSVIATNLLRRLNVELYPASILRSPSSYLVLVTTPLPFYRHLVTWPLECEHEGLELPTYPWA